MTPDEISLLQTRDMEDARCECGEILELICYNNDFYNPIPIVKPCPKCTRKMALELVEELLNNK